ncbi:hypothetical protein BDV40DRAFT_255087 [Aspergillus tamarii]|uniref:Uncharacterized protein n=1 Tax=Aspergillus tamarii TaxID=41984 RepID=A0A5N6V6F6_ASPTM|nr:hypothetical protein BDV40DRAFT_255087 [Aspergillus tamarii]
MLCQELFLGPVSVPQLVSLNTEHFPEPFHICQDCIRSIVKMHLFKYMNLHQGSNCSHRLFQDFHVLEQRKNSLVALSIPSDLRHPLVSGMNRAFLSERCENTPHVLKLLNGCAGLPIDSVYQAIIFVEHSLQLTNLSRFLHCVQKESVCLRYCLCSFDHFFKIIFGIMYLFTSLFHPSGKLAEILYNCIAQRD